ncbi:MAG: hypothetical protein HC781_01615 [Leptolyngbyaceae cyanobacterium CSU_1_4]|nr:hypothetical protein [Leptolyngbyaceae cyanobacterium CSU_1_4]
MTEATLDRIAVAELPDRYGIKRAAFYERIKPLGLEFEKEGNQTFANANQLALMDGLHDAIKAGTKAAFLKALDSSTGQVIQSAIQSGLSGGLSDERITPLSTSSTLELVQMLMQFAQAGCCADTARVAQSLPPSPQPPFYEALAAKLQFLETCAAKGWQLSSSDLRSVLGLASTPSCISFQRYGFSFIAAGRQGRQLSWRIEKALSAQAVS